MPKTRISTADILVLSENLKSLLGLRVANIYDVNPRTYLIKLVKPDVKKWLLIESGLRMHVTNFSREKNATPSGFTMKLRKHLRTKRLEQVRQLGSDRVIELVFGSGEVMQRLILEFYAKGNIILTDSEYQMVTVLRMIDLGDRQVRAQAKYPIENIRQRQVATRDLLVSVLKDGVAQSMTLKHCLNTGMDYGPELCEHAVLFAGLTNGTKLTDESQAEELAEKLLPGFADCDRVIQESEAGEQSGFVITTPRDDEVALLASNQEQSSQAPAPSDSEAVVYEEFVPFLLLQHKGKDHKEFPTFSEAMDEFFSKSEAQKDSLKKAQIATKAKKKLEAAKAQQQAWIAELGQDSRTNVEKAQLIEYNMREVDMAIQVIRSALANSVDWTALKRIVKTEQRKGDPIAAMICELRLETNEIVLLLSNDLDNATDEEMTQETARVAVDLNESAYGNARRYYALKKKLSGKQDRAKEMADVAMKKQERTYEETLKKAAVKSSITQIRKTYWFEKFYWFISSENFLVLAGKDKQQNELLVKRYMKKEDIYVHADMHGASTVLIKNTSGRAIPPPSTLQQAGEFAVCRSAAWDNKVSMGAYWVYSHQVSKTAPTGEYLTTGSFMVRGRKNYLPPVQLVMGYSFLFRIEDSCLGNHASERVARYADDVTDAFDAPTPLELPTEEEPEDAGDIVPPTADQEDGDTKEESQGDATPKPSTPASAYIAADDSSDDDHARHHKFMSTAPASSAVSASSRKYIPDDVDDASDADSDDPSLAADDPMSETASVTSSIVSSTTGRRISAKERRAMRKARARGGAAPPTETTAPKPPKPKKAPQPAPAPAKRGKKAKLKKMRRKYADQDDEERELAMQLLGSAGPVKHEPQPLADANAGNEDGKGDSTNANVARHQARQAKEKEDAATAAELAALFKEEGIKELSDADRAALSELSLFTGQPREDDVLLYAIPVCGPYSAFQNYKYRAKLLPGQQKRGKAANQVQRMFTLQNGTTNREKDLLHSAPDHERMPIMPNNVQISGTAAQLSKGKGGKGGKGGKKGGGKKGKK